MVPVPIPPQLASLFPLWKPHLRPFLDGGSVSSRYPRSSDVHARYLHPPCPASSPARFRRGRDCSVGPARAHGVRECARPRADCRRGRKSHRRGGQYFDLAEGRDGSATTPSPRMPNADSAIRRTLRRFLQDPAWPAGRQSGPRTRSAAGQLARLRLRHRLLRHRGHQQPRDRRSRRDHRDLQRRLRAQGRTDRQGPEDRHRAAEGQARASRSRR